MSDGGTQLPRRRLMAVVVGGLLLVSACAEDCKTSCLPHGTYVDLNADLGTASARICYDDGCHDVLAGQGGEPDQATNGFQFNVWEEGRRVTLSITVFDAAGKVVGAVTEQRTMDSGGCACGVLFYDWRGGKLHRLT